MRERGRGVAKKEGYQMERGKRGGSKRERERERDREREREERKNMTQPCKLT